MLQLPVLGAFVVALSTRHAMGGSVGDGQPTPPWLLQGDLGDTAQTCDVDAVRGANIHQLHPILHDLVNTTFFRLFRVSLKNPTCPYWKTPEKEPASEGGSCGGGPADAAAPSFLTMGKKDIFGTQPPVKAACDVDAEEEPSGFFGGSTSAFGGSFSKDPGGLADDDADEEDAVDRSMTVQDQVAQEARKDDQETCEFEEDLPTYFADMCGGGGAEIDGNEDVNLIRNPERNTGYNGSHIWEAMYSENCFEVGSPLPRGRFGANSMCYEERVLYRLLSGWHASTTISITKYFYAPGTKSKTGWSANPVRYMESLGRHPERLKNLHFSFVVMLRAIKKAAPFLQSYKYSTGDRIEDSLTSSLMDRLLGSQVLSVCSPLFDAFDETRLFSSIKTPEQRSQVKRQFKSVFRNITGLVDCVQCSKCRLHAKLFSLGLGAALKILLTPPELIGSTTSRDEVVALVNVLWKLSDTMEDARELTQLYWQQHFDPSSSIGIAESPASAATPAAGGVPSAGGVGSSAELASAVLEQKLPPQQLPFQQPPPPQQQSPTTTAPRASAAPEALAFGAMQADERRGLIDLAIGAVRRAADSSLATSAEEEGALRSLVARPVSEELLILARHYASERPGVFARIAAAADAVATSGAAAPGLLPAAARGSAAATPVATPAPPRPDAVIIGGGLAGMVAAVSILDRGGRVTIVEKQPYLGGNSGKASSGINAALETSVESLVADTTKSAGALARSDLITTLATDSPVAVSWLRDRTSVDLSLRSQLGGHTVQRTLRPANAFVGAEVTFAIGQLLNKLAAEEPGRLKLLFKNKWTGLARKGDLWHVSVVANGTEAVLQTPAVIISSGGFGHDAKESDSLMRKYRPDLESFPTTLGPQTTGDGVKIARDIGARLVDMDRVQLHPTGFVDPAKPVENTKTLAAELLRGVGGLLLDRTGARFTDELGTRQAVVNAELNSAASFNDSRRVSWLVINGKAAAVADRHTTLYTKKGLLTRVKGLEGLAAFTNISFERLQSTFTEYNDAAAAGKDKFGRIVFPKGHWPIAWDEEFVVGQVVPVIHYTMGGIAIDVDGRVLSEADGAPMAGLYAIGEASGGVHGDNRLAGNSLLECTVFGRRVGLGLPIGVGAPATAMSATPAAGSQGQVQAAAAGPAGAEAPKQVSLEEMKEHGSKAPSHWVALYGKVYDLTDYAEAHPGGVEAITDVAGGDGTEHFETVHNKELLDSMGFEPIGDLAAD